MSRRYHNHATIACPAGPPDRIGVTIATPDAHADLAREAVARWARFTGLPGVILSAPPQGAYWVKYDLAALLGLVRICYFDADVWMCRPPDLDALWRDDVDVQAVADPGVLRSHDFPFIDCARWEMDRARYFNSGWFTADLRRPVVREWLDLARMLTRDTAAGRLPRLEDFGEQSYLNAAAQQLPELRVELVGAEWNWLKIGHVHGVTPLPRKVWNVHAAGYPAAEKRAVLEAMCRTFEDQQ